MEPSSGDQAPGQHSGHSSFQRCPGATKPNGPACGLQHTLWWSGKAGSVLFRPPVPAGPRRPASSMGLTRHSVVGGRPPWGRSGCSRMRRFESRSQTLAIWQDANRSVPRFPHLWEHQVHDGIVRTQARSAGVGRGLPRQSGWARQPSITMSWPRVRGGHTVGGGGDSPLPGGCDFIMPGSLSSGPRVAQPAKGSTVWWLQTIR